ncbi:hypothetical protein QQM39_03355 [Streptomyces sp. DT2A-34]|uniref:DUF6777 domain-containing protein n=1 Tax=Streptomyces sp. DT2A-34 TaxID=3051182 RepID=UPI00265BE632|nr:DUF6777 domain-containing protein [Streptomyces sp. DT2A-34]MDO0909931.1 hypothetical protein [Streptomyces sp. DT2A-34]
MVPTPTPTIVTACALSAALAVAGCGAGDGDKGPESSGEVLLQPAAAQGPDPFTDSTATSPVTRTPRPAHAGRAGLQALSGETPGLYGGTRGAGSCDVQRQIDRLTADRARARVFAQAAGVSQRSIPGYLRGLTSVVLRADTRVTNHGYRDGMGTGYQSVLQAGTAVLVDSRGVPRVRCACGNPLAPPVGLRGRPETSGRPWSGYRPDQVIVVAPTTQVITNITIIDIADNTWIERPIGHRGHDRDHVVRPPKPVTPTPLPRPHDSASSSSSGEGSATPSHQSPTDCATPTVTVTPGATDQPPKKTPADEADAADRADTAPADCPSATVTASPPTTDPGRTPASPASPESSEPAESSDESTPSDSRTAPDTSPSSPDSRDAPQETRPEAVPDTPDVPDGGGPIPDAPGTNDSIFGSPTDVFDG